ncbi:uncharacterized protein LOC117104552 [Anneissia japonica]|uniref:uncharacterized protein LOC117104552 n=1 Tax=Anneissia japonica TaxID=1529436 RepID=UPI001425653E|nr:uncharacterized protein LOC117104552 [Anneissia japonica]
MQNDLDRVVSVWNCHNIRRSKNENVPDGRPVVMYTMPLLYETRDYLIATEQTDIDACCNACTFREGIPCDPEMYELLEILKVHHGLESPADVHQALDLYHTLRPIVLHAFNEL